MNKTEKEIESLIKGKFKITIPMHLFARKSDKEKAEIAQNKMTESDKKPVRLFRWLFKLITSNPK